MQRRWEFLQDPGKIFLYGPRIFFREVKNIFLERPSTRMIYFSKLHNLRLFFIFI
jgi:hypothetical protein